MRESWSVRLMPLTQFPKEPGSTTSFIWKMMPARAIYCYVTLWIRVTEANFFFPITSFSLPLAANQQSKRTVP